MSNWEALDDELDTWRSAGRTATLWLRDDDACTGTPALARLLSAATASGVPLALATIPARMDDKLAAVVRGMPGVTLVQHGWSHANHAPPGERGWELGAHRPAQACATELAEGLARLSACGAPFVAVLVPPWNRIAPPVVALLPRLGFVGLSTFGPRDGRWAADGVLQCNAHVDLIAWRRGKAFIGTRSALERTIEHLRARREGSADADEPTGILTHHLDMGEDAWRFLEAFLARTRAHRAVAWLDAGGVFAAARGTA